ncbi:MAG: hypothetical protein JST76_01755 [Bacteroidetes bacterium]|nr:hypothetical protein [Bacteroidota bacterium]
MKTYLYTRVLILLLSLFVAHHGYAQAVPERDTVYVHDTIYISNNYDWREIFGFRYHDSGRDSIAGYPLDYYTLDTACSAYAIGFLGSSWRPSCDRMTDELLALAVRKDPKFHPLYVWCLFMTLRISDGCLAENVGLPARRYAEVYPKEFFAAMDQPRDSDMYALFIEAIRYSGDEASEHSPDEVRAHIEARMLSHCTGCSAALHQRIHQFSVDCTLPFEQNTYDR